MKGVASDRLVFCLSPHTTQRDLNCVSLTPSLYEVTTSPGRIGALGDMSDSSISDQRIHLPQVFSVRVIASFHCCPPVIPLHPRKLWVVGAGASLVVLAIQDFMLCIRTSVVGSVPTLLISPTSRRVLGFLCGCFLITGFCDLAWKLYW